ncbi:MAG: virulence factor [Actinomycetota bacterium]
MAELTVIRWRDIPMQLVARGEGDAAARALLPERFQEAVDAAAMVAGMIGSDDYTEQMQMERRACGEDLDAEVAAEQERLEVEWTDDVLRAAIRSGGIKGGPDVAGETEAVRPSGNDGDPGDA